MKTINFWTILLFVGVISLSLLSCSDDEEPKPLSQAIGTYDYRMKIYIKDGSTLLYLGSSTDITGTAVLSETSQGFEVKEGGELFFRGTKIAEASNGFTFDIETQTVDFDGDKVEVEGYDGATLGAVKYNGLYETSPKLLTAYMQFEGIFSDDDGNEYEVDVVLEFIGKKL